MATVSQGHERTISFHTRAYGTNIRIENNGQRAIRFASFDQGLSLS